MVIYAYSRSRILRCFHLVNHGHHVMKFSHVFTFYSIGCMISIRVYWVILDTRTYHTFMVVCVEVSLDALKSKS